MKKQDKKIQQRELSILQQNRTNACKIQIQN